MRAEGKREAGQRVGKRARSSAGNNLTVTRLPLQRSSRARRAASFVLPSCGDEARSVALLRLCDPEAPLRGPPPPPASLCRRFQLLNLCPAPQGFSSSVSQAYDRISNTDVALKIYDKARLSELNRAQVEREVRIHMALQHMYIIQLYAAWEDERAYYLVQEFACEVRHHLAALQRLVPPCPSPPSCPMYVVVGQRLLLARAEQLHGSCREMFSPRYTAEGGSCQRRQR